MKQISFPKIGQFPQVVSDISRKITFTGLDENGDAIYDPTIEKPTLTFTGSVKLHGTNAGISYNDEYGIWAQSKENVITSAKDNAGFAFFVESNEDLFKEMMIKIASDHNIDTSIYTLTIYGEWVGKKVQKTVAISGIEKSLFIFGLKVSKIGDLDFSAYWLDSAGLRSPDHRVYNILDYKTFKVDVDFNMPKLAQKKFVELVEEVENECPVAKEFGHIGIGEGIVWSVELNGAVYRFKTKGDKHAGKSKVKTIKKVDNEKLMKIMETAERVTPTWRLDQMLTASCDLMNGGVLDRKKLGDYIRMVIKDVLDEDLHIISDAGLEPKDINKQISDICRRFFFDREKDNVGL